MIERVETDRAPKPVGPYSQAIAITLPVIGARLSKLVFVSGMVPIDPTTNRPVSGDFEEQVRRTLLNLKAVIEAAGGSLKNIVKVTVFINDISLFEVFNRIYSEFMGDHRPARSVIQAIPPKGFPIEIEAIAYIEVT